jgi:protein SCO1/2
MKALRYGWWMVALAGVLFAGCQNASDSPKDKDKLYDVKGKVVAVDADNNKVTLDHEDIPGLMKAMEMKFPVADAKMFEGIKPGDEVYGKLKKQSGSYLITELHKR